MKNSLLSLAPAALCGILMSILSASAAQTGVAKPASRQWTVIGHIPVEKFMIQSHRGAGELAPENTIEAFELGWKLGTVPESDIRTTRDGVIVAFHDANFKRTVKNVTPDLEQKGVPDVTYAELLKLDVGGWKGEEFSGRRVSRISDVFKIMTGNPERLLYMDIKQVDIKQLASEVKEQKVESQVIFTSPKYEQIQEWKSLVPQSRTLHWLGGTQKEIEGKLAKLRPFKYEGITQLQVHVRLNTNSASSEPFNLTREFIRKTGEELRRHGVLYQALPWGVAEPKVYWQLLDLGVAAFATDHPEITVKAVRDYYTSKTLSKH